MHELKKYLLMPLVLVGALNWGLVGMFNFDLVAAILPNPDMARIAYSIVGLAAVGVIIFVFAMDKKNK